MAELMSGQTAAIAAVSANLLTVFGAVLGVIVTVFTIKKVYSMITKS